MNESLNFFWFSEQSKLGPSERGLLVLARYGPARPALSLSQLANNWRRVFNRTARRPATSISS